MKTIYMRLILLTKETKIFVLFFEAEDCFYLDRSTGSRYVELSEHLAEKKFSFLNLSDVDKNFIRIQFLTTDSQVKVYEEISNYKGKKVYHETHMWGEKSINNDGIINLKFDENKSRIIEIKEKFEQLIGERLYEFKDFVYSDDSKNLLEKLEKNKDFKLCHFTNYRECYRNLIFFSNEVQFFCPPKRCSNKKDGCRCSILYYTTIMQRFDEMIKKDLEKLAGDSEKSQPKKRYTIFKAIFYERKDVSNRKKALKTYKSLLKKCFFALRFMIREKSMFFYIDGKYDIDYYFREFYNLARNSVKKFQEKYEKAASKDKDVIFQEISKSFCDSLLKLQSKVHEDLFENDFIHEKLLSLTGKYTNTSFEIINVESIISDYLNMTAYLFNLSNITKKQDFITYHYPLNFNRDHKCKIINFLKIKLKTSFSNGFGKIKAFNEKGEKVKFRSNVHFFLKQLKNHEFYCTSEVLRELNIKKIKITTLNKDLCEIVEVDKFLSD